MEISISLPQSNLIYQSESLIEWNVQEKFPVTNFIVIALSKTQSYLKVKSIVMVINCLSKESSKWPLLLRKKKLTIMNSFSS